jgi:hypothetical protein
MNKNNSMGKETHFGVTQMKFSQHKQVSFAAVLYMASPTQPSVQ